MGVRVFRYLVPALMMVLVMSFPSASAAIEEGEEQIAWQDHLAIEISQPFGEWEIKWLITVDEGPEVDVLFLPERGYEEYLDINYDEFTHIAMGTTLQTNLSSKSFKTSLYGTHYVVIDNSDICYIPEDEEKVEATVSYYISFELASTVGDGGSSSNDGETDLLGSLVCAVVMLGGFLLSIIMVFSRGRARPRVPITLSPPSPGYMQQGFPPPGQPRPPGGHYPPQYPPGGPPPQAYRARPPTPPPPQPPPYRQSVYHDEDTTYIVQESPSMSLDTTDYYAEQLAQQNRDRKRFGRR